MGCSLSLKPRLRLGLREREHPKPPLPPLVFPFSPPCGKSAKSAGMWGGARMGWKHLRSFLLLSLPRPRALNRVRGADWARGTDRAVKWARWGSAAFFSVFLVGSNGGSPLNTAIFAFKAVSEFFAFYRVHRIWNFAVPGSWEVIDILFSGFSEVRRTVLKSVCRYHAIFTVLDAGVLTHHPRVKRCKRGAIEFFRARI